MKIRISNKNTVEFFQTLLDLGYRHWETPSFTAQQLVEHYKIEVYKNLSIDRDVNTLSGTHTDVDVVSLETFIQLYHSNFVKIPTKKTTKFQVNTFDLEGVKKGLIELYEKHLGKVTGVNHLLEKDHSWFVIHTNVKNNIGYNFKESMQNDCPILTIEEAILFIQNYNRSTIININSQLKAEVFAESVKIGEHHLTMETIQKIVDEAKKLK